MKVLLTVSLNIIFLAISSNSWGHGSVPIEEDNCAIFKGSNIVHFSAYQPTIEEKSQYCEEVPSTGKTIIVADLFNDVLRNIPTTLRLVKSGSDNNEVLATLPPQLHQNGVLELHVDFPTTGQYVAILEALGESHYLYQFPITVGTNSGGYGNLIFLMFLISGFIGFMVYRTRKRITEFDQREL